MKHIDIKELFSESKIYIGQCVTVCGWVRTSADVKSMIFIQINDGTTSLRNLQLSINRSTIVDGGMSINIRTATTVGTSVRASGEIVASDRNGIELVVHELDILGECPGDYPLQKKKTSVDFLRTIPHLRVRTNYIKSVLTVRARLAYSIHKYFTERGYKYLHAPIITKSDCEGAGDMFRLTTQPWDAKYDSAEEYYSDDYFGCKAGLAVSCQLEGEMAAVGGLGKIYTFGPTFRAEHSDTSKHVAEFWHVEPEACFVDINEIIDIAQDFIKTIINDALENCAEELEFFEKYAESGLVAKLKKVVSKDFVRLDYTEAIQLLSQNNENFKYKIKWGDDIQSEHEHYITETLFDCPVFVINFPKELKAFYMKQNDDGKTVAATDLLVPGIGEIIGCSERETDYNKLLEAMKARNMPISEYQEYLDLRKYGSVQHSGFGLGFDRLVMYVTGVGNIRDVLQFPRTYKHIY